MNKYWVLILFLFAFYASAFSQEPRDISEVVFKGGEQLSYRLKYGFLTGAEATLHVEEEDKEIQGHPTYHIVVDGKTAGSVNVFFKVRNRYESYIDRNTLLPYYYSENRKEGGYSHSDKVTFDKEGHKITADKGTFPYKGKVFDFVSAYYFAREIDVSRLSVGDKIDMDYFLDDGVHQLTVTYMGKEKIDCILGTFNCLKFNPTIIPGHIFRKDSKLYLWITDDNNRIPVKAHVELVVGSVTMDLTDARGLKYPLNPINK